MLESGLAISVQLEGRVSGPMPPAALPPVEDPPPLPVGPSATSEPHPMAAQAIRAPIAMRGYIESVSPMGKMARPHVWGKRMPF